MEDGKKYTNEVRYPKGDPENPLSWDEMLKKFERCTVNYNMQTDKKNKLIESVRNIEKKENMRDLTALLG
jgi:2-methylcitrate dehydratase PrpD